MAKVIKRVWKSARPIGRVWLRRQLAGLGEEK